jgi:hypothetical protein
MSKTNSNKDSFVKCFLSLIENFRLKLRAKLRHLRKNPGNIDLETIQSEREELTTLFIKLKQLQQVAGVAEPNAPNLSSSETVDGWDDLAFDPVPISGEPTSSNSEATPARSQIPTNVVGPVTIEDQIIALPSNGNTNEIYRNLEITHRISTSEDLLNHIRNLIAEKSFQFSHVIRVSPRKGVTTRARAAVRKLNNQIAEQCRFYTRCRSSLLILGADPSILSHFKVLNPTDVVASTAILNPNQPGSTSIKLSWIWQTSARNLLEFAGPNDSATMADDIPSLLECMHIFCYFVWYFYLTILVRRIHWLRARAQRMRWQEEVTLTTYEMQWTVRYFTHKSKFWSDALIPPAGPASLADVNAVDAGTLAYSKRKNSSWYQLALKSDRTFKIFNNAYKSPL